jgi:hypothetical protein
MMRITIREKGNFLYLRQVWAFIKHICI